MGGWGEEVGQIPVAARESAGWDASAADQQQFGASIGHHPQVLGISLPASRLRGLRSRGRLPLDCSCRARIASPTGSMARMDEWMGPGSTKGPQEKTTPAALPWSALVTTRRDPVAETIKGIQSGQQKIRLDVTKAAQDPAWTLPRLSTLLAARHSGLRSGRSTDVPVVMATATLRRGSLGLSPSREVPEPFTCDVETLDRLRNADVVQHPPWLGLKDT